jgi:hypothetical protein
VGLNQWADDRADDGQGTGERPVPRHGRAALLRLASWFEEAGTDRADDLARAAYALHPALHLEGRVDESVAATTSWWQAEPDRSTVVEHPGTRPPAPVRDHRAQQARLRDAAESSAHWRRAGASQIRALLTEPTGDRARLDLSGAGMEVLMELLTAALGAGDASRRSTSAGDLEFSLRLHVVAAPGAEVTVQGEGGDLTLEGVRLCVTPYEQHVLDLPEPGADASLGGPPQNDAPADTRAPSSAPGAVRRDDDPLTGPRADVPADPSDDVLAGPVADPLAPSGADTSGSYGADPLAPSGPGTSGSHGGDALAPSGAGTSGSHGGDALAPTGGSGDTFAELAGVVADALAQASRSAEPATPPEAGGRPDQTPRPRHGRPPGDPVEDPRTTDSLGGADRERHPDPDADPDTETTGPMDLSSVREGRRRTWG